MHETIGIKSRIYSTGFSLAGILMLVGAAVVLFVLILPDDELIRSPVWLGPISLFAFGSVMLIFGIKELRLPREVIVLRGSTLFFARKKKEISLHDIKEVNVSYYRGHVSMIIITSNGTTFDEAIKNPEQAANTLRKKIKERTGRDI